MYKSELQQLCQRRKWSLPEYAVTRDGPDHNPCFLASVTVNGDRFSSSVSSSSSKEAQNKAAKVAFEKLFSSEPPPAPAPSLARASFGVVPPLPSPEGSVEDAMYKSKLQELCQRRRWALPGYAVTRDGPDHNPSFLASVTVNGEQFSSSISSSSSKEAQNKAAKVAFEKLFSATPPVPSLPRASFGVGDQFSSSVPSSPSKEVQDTQVAFEKLSFAAPPPVPCLPRASFSQPSFVTEAHEGQMCKIQLEVLCQRRRWALPEYTVTRDGPDHNPRFLASVVVNGDQFSATAPSSSSKEAHNTAAQVALEKLSAALSPVPSLARSSSSCSDLVTEAGGKVNKISSGYPSHWHVEELDLSSSMVALSIKKPITTSGPEFDKDDPVIDIPVASTLELADAENTDFMTKNMDDNCSKNPQSAVPTEEDINLKKHDASSTVQKSNPIASVLIMLFLLQLLEIPLKI